jgi:hypothetical protein
VISSQTSQPSRDLTKEFDVSFHDIKFFQLFPKFPKIANLIVPKDRFLNDERQDREAISLQTT